MVPLTTEPDFLALADEYARQVQTGAILACKWIRLATRRYLDDRAREADPDWPHRFDEAKALRVCRFISRLPHSKGKWAAARELIRLEPWQCWLLVSIFGFVRKRDGLRRFRQAMVVIPRKNGKSALAAGIGLYMLAADGEHSAEVFCGAGSEKQAWEVFRPARLMAQSTPALVRHYGIEVNARNLHIAANGSRFEPVIGKPGDGASPSCAILDEFHEHDTPDLRDTMVTGMGAREQPLLLAITTAGDNLAGPCFDDVLTNRKVLEGTVEDDERFYAEWAIDADVPWDSPAAIRMANPNLDVSVSEEFLVARQREAVRNTREQGRFKTKHLNLWLNARSAYFNMQSWATCRAPALSLDDMRGRRCYLGCDLASKVDIAAVQLLFPLDDGTYFTAGRYYLPETVLDDPGRDHYRGWHLDGQLILTDGSMIDHQRIADDIDELRRLYTVEEVVFDPAQATWLMGQLSDKRVPVYEFVQHAKNYSEPMKQVAALIDAGKMRHADGPSAPMTWMLSNVVSRTNAKDEVFPAKERPDQKIDGPVALIMAMARAMLNASKRSAYEDRGLMIFG